MVFLYSSNIINCHTNSARYRMTKMSSFVIEKFFIPNEIIVSNNPNTFSIIKFLHNIIYYLNSESTLWLATLDNIGNIVFIPPILKKVSLVSLLC